MTSPMLPSPPRRPGGHLIDARLSLLDRQLLDVHDQPVNVVDDLELSDVEERVLPPDGPAPQVLALVHGPIILEPVSYTHLPEAVVHFRRTDRLEDVVLDA